jgi:hypothetical protein
MKLKADQELRTPDGPGSGAAAAVCWQVVATCQPGSTHLCRGQPCADRYERAQVAGAIILVVADGAGSAARGAEGAAIAARSAVRLAASSLVGAPPTEEAGAQCDFVREVLRQTLAAVQEEIAAADLAEPASCPADFLSTLLLAILTESWLMAGNIGDGWLVARDRQGALRAVAPPSRGEYVNETFFLTSAGAIDEAVIAVEPAAELDAVALMSDGPAWFALDLEQGAPSRPLFEKLFAFAGDPALSAEEKDRALAAFLASPAICGKTDDDKTLILAVRAAGAPPADDVR